MAEEFRYITSTRAYHNARKEWASKLDVPEQVKSNSKPVIAIFGIADLDDQIAGKEGIFFNTGTVFYTGWRPNANPLFTLGHGKLIMSDPGALVSLVDDLHGMTFGEACMTKRLRVFFTDPFDVSLTRTFRFQAFSEVKQTKADRKDISGQAILLDDSNRVLAWSDADFVQNGVMMMQGTLNENVINERRQKRWEKLQPHKLFGANLSDPAMDFSIVSPQYQRIKLPMPKEWPVVKVGVQAGKQSKLLKGRVAIEHIFYTDKFCCAVVQPLDTCEGPPGMMHGGAAATTWLDVLAVAQEMSKLRVFTIHYKRPIPQEIPTTIEWTKLGLDWQGVVKDFDGKVLQEVIAEFGPTSSLL